MTSNKKVISLGLDYSQFDGGITEVNRKMGVLDSQFKLASEQTKAFGNETDQLTLKQEQLTQKINLQTQKVKLSKEAYDNAIESGKASDKQLDNLLKTYNNNETALQRLNNEIVDNKTKLDNSSKSAESFGDSIRGMASALGIEVSPALEAVAKKFDGLDKNVGNAILTIGIITTTLASFTVSAANMADELLELSSVTGITTDELQKMQYASDFLDVEVNTMTGSMTKLIRSMNSAREGTDAQEKAFGKLHIRYKETNDQLRDVNEVFYETIDALGRVKNETERDALAMTLMGKSAKDLNPLIEAGSNRLKELGIEAENMGVILGGDSLNDLGEFKDSMDKLNNTMEATKLKLGLILLPILQDFADLISEIPTPVMVGVIVFGSLAAIFISVAKAASTMAIANAALSVTNTTLGATGAIATMGMGPLLLILLAIAAAIALIVGGTVGIKSAMNDVKTSTEGIINSANTSTSRQQSTATQGIVVRKQSQYGNYYYDYEQSNSSSSRGFASGTDDYPGGYSWVGEAGPELRRFPRGTQIKSNAESKAMTSGGDSYYITIDAKNVQEFNDVVNIMQSYKQTHRQGVVKRG